MQVVQEKIPALSTRKNIVKLKILLFSISQQTVVSFKHVRLGYERSFANLKLVIKKF